MWIGDRIFFLSDHEGVGNLYSCTAAGREIKHHTSHDDYYVRFPSSDGRRIVYHAGADLYVYDPDDGETRRVEIDYHSPRLQRQRKFVDAIKHLETYAAARTMAAFIDLNPVRAGMVGDPAEYRWSSYGEAVGGGGKGTGKKDREGLVRAISSDTDTGFDAGKWKHASRRYRRLLGITLERKSLNAKVEGLGRMRITRNEAEALESGDNQTVLPELKMSAMLRRVCCGVRGICGWEFEISQAFSTSIGLPSAMDL